MLLVVDATERDEWECGEDSGLMYLLRYKASGEEEKVGVLLLLFIVGCGILGCVALSLKITCGDY